jgi:hypothetical protein
VRAFDLLLSERADEQQRKLAQAASHDAHEIERRFVGPVQVVEDDHGAFRLTAEERQEGVEDSVAVAHLEGCVQAAARVGGNVGNGGEGPGGHNAVAAAPERRPGRAVPAEDLHQGRFANASLPGKENQPPVITRVVKVAFKAVEQRLPLQESHPTIVLSSDSTSPAGRETEAGQGSPSFLLVQASAEPSPTIALESDLGIDFEVITVVPSRRGRAGTHQNCRALCRAPGLSTHG